MRLAIFISGRGSNMRALIEAANAAECPVQVVLVASNRRDALGLKFAEGFGIRTHIADDREMGWAEVEASLCKAVQEAGIDLIALAGFMRILSPDFVEHWSGRLVNIHPSLLPEFPGLHTHRRVLAAGCRVTGCTVHMVTHRVDSGDILGQKRVAVRAGDDEDTLAVRVLAAEHILYPRCISALCRRLGGTVGRRS